MLFLPLALLATLPVALAATVCNGHAELCDRSYGNVSFIGAHDSYAISASQLAGNQDQNITTQLDNGIRMLQVQAHYGSGNIRLCHSSCLLLDGGLLSTYLTEVNSWAVANPTEVLSLLIVNIDNLNASTYDTVFKASGLDTISYAPSKATTTLSSWPTLGSMIDSGLRVVTFMDNSADFTMVPYIIDEFSNMFEDAYDVLENSFPCIANRSTGDPSTQLMLTNHYLDKAGGTSGITLPNKAQLSITNGANGTGSVGQGAINCVAAHSRNPNFFLLDFYDAAGLAPFNVVAELNGVSAPTNDVATYTGGNGTTTSTSSNSNPSMSVTSLSGAQASSSVGSMGIWVLVAGLIGGLATI